MMTLINYVRNDKLISKHMIMIIELMIMYNNIYDEINE